MIRKKLEEIEGKRKGKIRKEEEEEIEEERIEEWNEEDEMDKMEDIYCKGTPHT